MIEISTVLLKVRNVGLMMDNSWIVFVSGIACLFIYPLVRISICIYNLYDFYYGVAHLFVGSGCIPFALLFNAFVFCISVYYTIFGLWWRPESMYRLRKRKVE